MIQLSYQPALDSLHTTFRVLRMRAIIVAVGAVERDLVRIMDFYLLFPFLVRSIRLAPAHQIFKKLAEKYTHLAPYGEQPEPRVLLQRMEPMQLAAFDTLALHGYLDSEALSLARVLFTTKPVPASVAERIEEVNSTQQDLLEFLGTVAGHYRASGESGFKARSGLMEHRYDAL